MHRAAAAAARAGGAKGPKQYKVIFTPIEKWVTVLTQKHKDRDSAKTMLKKVCRSCTWKQDIGCARTTAKGGITGWRFVNVQAIGAPHLARIIDTNDGKWTCEKPIFKDVEEDDDEDEDDEE